MGKRSDGERSRIIPKKLESTRKNGLINFIFAILYVVKFITILLSGVELSEDSYCRIMEDVLQFEYGKSESKRRLTLLAEGLTLRTKERRDCQCMLHTGS